FGRQGCGRAAVRSREPTQMGSVAGVCRDVRPRSGPCAWRRLARLVATYLLILAFVTPLQFTGTARPVAHRGQKSGRRQRGAGRRPPRRRGRPPPPRGGGPAPRGGRGRPPPPPTHPPPPRRY